MDTLLLLGAGASYGSDTSGTPPKGNELFDALRRFNPDGWGNITGELAQHFRTDFEGAMQVVPPQNLAPLQRAMAAYFFEFSPAPSNLYVALAKRIAARKWTGVICTLNYERLLELSLMRADVQPFIGSPPTGRYAVELCLPHGCCHLFCDSARAQSGAVVFNGYNVQTDGVVSVVADAHQHRARITQDAFPPVMSYFEPQKRTTAGHSFIEGQRDRWSKLASSAKTIVIVGVQVRPHDTHIWNPIAASSGRVVYCGGASASESYITWARAHRNAQNDRVLKGYFKDEFDVICHELGLN